MATRSPSCCRPASCATGCAPITGTGCACSGRARTRASAWSISASAPAPRHRAGPARDPARGLPRCSVRKPAVGRGAAAIRADGRSRRSARGYRGAARPALHVRRLRRGQAQRVRPCLRAPRRRAPGERGVQPALPLWRRRARQDASDARHRLGTARRQARASRSPTCRPRSSCTASSPRSARNRRWSSRSSSAASTC